MVSFLRYRHSHTLNETQGSFKLTFNVFKCFMSTEEQLKVGRLIIINPCAVKNHLFTEKEILKSFTITATEKETDARICGTICASDNNGNLNRE